MKGDNSCSIFLKVCKWAAQTAQRQKAEVLVEYNNSADHGFPFGGSIYLKVCKSLY